MAITGSDEVSISKKVHKVWVCSQNLFLLKKFFPQPKLNREHIDGQRLALDVFKHDTLATMKMSEFAFLLLSKRFQLGKSASAETFLGKHRSSKQPLYRVHWVTPLEVSVRSQSIIKDEFMNTTFKPVLRKYLQFQIYWEDFLCSQRSCDLIRIFRTASKWTETFTLRASLFEKFGLNFLSRIVPCCQTVFWGYVNVSQREQSGWSSQDPQNFHELLGGVGRASWLSVVQRHQHLTGLNCCKQPYVSF